jgi:hypothetical protein
VEPFLFFQHHTSFFVRKFNEKFSSFYIQGLYFFWQNEIGRKAHLKSIDDIDERSQIKQSFTPFYNTNLIVRQNVNNGFGTLTYRFQWSNQLAKKSNSNNCEAFSMISGTLSSEHTL